MAERLPQINQYLPGGWEARFDPRVNRYFFLNHQTKETTWEHPRNLVSNQSGRALNSNPIHKGIALSASTSSSTSGAQVNQNLPEGWEARFDSRVNQFFFLNHQTKETTWEDPRKLSVKEGSAVMNPKPVQQENSPITNPRSGGSSMDAGQQSTSLTNQGQSTIIQSASSTDQGKSTIKQPTSSTDQGQSTIKHSTSSTDQGQSSVLQNAKSFLQKSKEVQAKSSATLQMGNAALEKNNPTLPVPKISTSPSTSSAKNLDSENNKEMKVQLGLEFPGLSEKEIESALRSTSYNLNRARMILKIMSEKPKKQVAPPKVSIEIPEISGNSFDILKATGSNSTNNKIDQVQSTISQSTSSTEQGQTTILQSTSSNNQGQSSVLQDAKLFLQKSKDIQAKSSSTLRKGNAALSASSTSESSAKSTGGVQGDRVDIFKATNLVKSKNVKKDVSSKIKKSNKNSSVSEYEKNKENMDAVFNAFIKDEHDIATPNSNILQKIIINETPDALPSTSSQSKSLGNTVSAENMPKVTISSQSIIPNSAQTSVDSYSNQSSSVLITNIQTTSIKPNVEYFKQNKTYAASKSSYQTMKGAYVFQSLAKGHNKFLRNGHNKDLLITHHNKNDTSDLLHSLDTLLEKYSKPNLAKGHDKNLCKGPRSFTLGHDPHLCRGPMRLQRKQVR